MITTSPEPGGSSEPRAAYAGHAPTVQCAGESEGAGCSCGDTRGCAPRGTASVGLAIVVGDVLGTLLWTSVLAFLGWVVGRPALDLLDTVDHYALAITVGVLVVLVAVRSLRRRARPGR
ncbi:MAG: hypothetical protein JWM64_2722 [Frankiales bacterium]|nr:hypothetical protein [Frankiales bacterium]